MGVRTPTEQEHRYPLCQDEGCERYACRIYQEGYRAGYGAGHAAGEAEGYSRGFSAGMASCPGPHGKS